MSDPVTNFEIEDVLSSIRRLVSEGDRPRADARPAARADPSADPAADPSAKDPQRRAAQAGPPAQNAPVAHHFVLTPALRVDEPADVAAVPDTGVLLLTPTVGVRTGTDVSAETAAEGPVGTAAPDPAEDQDARLSVDPGVIAQSRHGAETTRSSAETADGDEAAAAPVHTGHRAARASLEDTIAELEAAITHQTDDWEPDGSEETPVVDWASASAQAGLFSARARPRPVVEDAEELPPREAERPQPDAIAGEAAARADTPDEPNDNPDDTATTFDTDTSAAAIFGDDTVIDEAALRDLVSDIVRQELQGKLGERITRNVRKLVRREIYRVISSEGFD